MHKILVVDDEARIVEILEKFLAKNGFEVIKSVGGENALELLRSNVKIDLLIIDMKMPQVTGFDVLKEKKKWDNKAPVIILTGSIDVEKHLSGLRELGYTQSDIAHKPVDLFALLEMVKGKLALS
jgi:DNA-binding NtrC family response regulator